MNKVLDKLTIKDVAYDGGTTIYKDFAYSNIDYSDISNTGLTIIKCNAMYNELNEGKLTTQYNKDYYIGDLSLEYEDGYCSNK